MKKNKVIHLLQEPLWVSPGKLKQIPFSAAFTLCSHLCYITNHNDTMIPLHLYIAGGKKSKQVTDLHKY